MKDETVFDPVTGKHLKSSSLARREKRAAFRAVKDRAKNEQAERLRKEAADADAERIHRERIALIVSELTPPILPRKILKWHREKKAPHLIRIRLHRRPATD